MGEWTTRCPVWERECERLTSGSDGSNWTGSEIQWPCANAAHCSLFVSRVSPTRRAVFGRHTFELSFTMLSHAHAPLQLEVQVRGLLQGHSLTCPTARQYSVPHARARSQHGRHSLVRLDHYTTSPGLEGLGRGKLGQTMLLIRRTTPGGVSTIGNALPPATSGEQSSTCPTRRTNNLPSSYQSTVLRPCPNHHQSKCVVLNRRLPVSVPLVPVYLLSDARSATSDTLPWSILLSSCDGISTLAWTTPATSTMLKSA